MNQETLRVRTPFPPLVDHEQWMASCRSPALAKGVGEILPRLRRLAILFDEILHQTEGFPVSVELRSSSNQYVIIIPDPTYSGHYRAQYFDERGFVGHTTFGTDPVNILERLLMNGFEHRAEGSLVALSRTDHWQLGMQLLQLKDAYESQKLTWAEYTQKYAEITSRTAA